MSQFIKFYFTSSMLNMFRALIRPSSGACDYFVVSPHWLRVLVLHWLCVLVLMCVGVSVWLLWGGIRVAGFSLQHGYHPNATTPKLQHASKQEHTTNVKQEHATNEVLLQKSSRLLMMDVLMSETC